MRKYKGAGIALLKKQNNDYAILLGKRTIKPNKGKWSIPGGKFEKNDNFFFETAIRELRKETGINLFDIVIEKKAIVCRFNYIFMFYPYPLHHHLDNTYSSHGIDHYIQPPELSLLFRDFLNQFQILFVTGFEKV